MYRNNHPDSLWKNQRTFLLMDGNSEFINDDDTTLHFVSVLLRHTFTTICNVCSDDFDLSTLGTLP